MLHDDRSFGLASQKKQVTKSKQAKKKCDLSA